MNEETIKYLQRALGVKDDGDIGSITRKAYADELIKIAEKEIGVKEIGNSNTGKRVLEYQDATFLAGTNWPWCAAFICWIIKQAEIFSEEQRPKTPAAYGFEGWADKIGMQKIKKPKEIKRGDLVIYNFSHIGIAASDSDKNGVFLAIEGNTNDAGSREGGSVLKKSRNRSTVRSVVRL